MFAVKWSWKGVKWTVKRGGYHTFTLYFKSKLSFQFTFVPLYQTLYKDKLVIQEKEAFLLKMVQKSKQGTFLILFIPNYLTNQNHVVWAENKHCSMNILPSITKCEGNKKDWEQRNRENYCLTLHSCCPILVLIFLSN